MKIEKTLKDGKLILAIDGRLDTITAPQFQETLLPAFDEAKELLLDFAELTYLSSAGLRVLLMGQKEAQAKNASMTIINVSGDIMEVFDMTGFTDILTIA